VVKVNLLFAGYSAPYLTVYAENVAFVYNAMTGEWLQTLPLKRVCSRDKSTCLVIFSRVWCMWRVKNCCKCLFPLATIGAMKTSVQSILCCLSCTWPYRGYLAVGGSKSVGVKSTKWWHHGWMLPKEVKLVLEVTSVTNGEVDSTLSHCKDWLMGYMW